MMSGKAVDFFGNYQVYSDSGVDITLLRRNLELSVTQRWQHHQAALAAVETFREAGRVRRRGDDSVAERASR